MTYRPLAAALLLPILPAALAAQPATRLDPVVVTATRTAVTADETLAAVTVVDRAEIERKQARTVADALRGTPGLAIANTGGRGAPTTVFLRGTESDQVLVLIDGVRVGSPTLGPAPFQDIPIDQVERIEVVRGPRSSLYGSEAIGGVIQIFTRKGGGPLRPRVSAGAGSRQSVEGSLGLSGGGDQGWFDANIAFERTDGFNACVGSLTAGCFTIEPDDDGFENASGSLRAGWRFSDQAAVDTHFLRSESDTEFDGSLFSGNELSTVQQVAGASATLAPLASWDLKLTAGRSWDEQDVFFDGAFLDQFDSHRDTFSWQNDLYLGTAHILTLGVDHHRDEIDSTVAFEETSRTNTGVFGQYQGDFGPHRLQLSARHDDNEQFGGQTTGSVAWGYDLGNDLRLTASYGTGFKAPTFNDLYFPFFGNPDLDPETSASTEIGIAGRHAGIDWSLNLFQTEVDDLIAFDGTLGPFGLPNNVDSTRIRGLEAIAGTRLASWDLNGNLTLLDPVNRSDGPNQGNLLPRRPEQSLTLEADRTLGRIRLGGTLQGVGRRFDDLANQVRLDSYLLVDLRAEYLFSDDLRVQARIENLFDEEYETAAYYNQPGRGFFLTLRYEPQM
jgi:vitamin B12 transporter